MRSLMLFLAALLCGAYGQTPIISPTITGEEGEFISFYCDSQVAASGLNLGFVVYDPSLDEFVSYQNTSARLLRVDDGQFANFTFRPLLASDDGTIFRCVSSGGLNSENATVSVTFSPIVSRLNPLDDPVTVTENSQVVVQLNVSGNPRPTFTWMRAGSSTPLSNSSIITATLDSLTINNIGREYAGQYVYEASNSAGSSNLTFTLDVQYKPEFPQAYYTPNTHNCTTVGMLTTCASNPDVDITFICNAIGNPTPNVSIVQPMPPESNVETSGNNIAIMTIRSENAGNYSCTARSSQFNDTVTRYFQLLVGGPPESVQDVFVSIGENAVNISWMYNNSVNGVPATDFVVIVRNANGDEIARYTTTASYISIPGDILEAGQMYTVSVVVNNQQGPSGPTSDIFTTPSGFNGALGMSISCLMSLLIVVSVMFLLS